MFDQSTVDAVKGIAGRLAVPVSSLLAIAEVEGGGVATATVNGKAEPLIRFEGHYFDARLSDAERAKARSLGLASPKVGKIANPHTQAARWRLLEKAKAINEAAALESCSWGVGQVMGAHWKMLGFANVFKLVEMARSGIAGQVELMARFIEKTGLHRALKAGDWRAFARGYNGPGFAKNNYHTKMEKAAAKWAKKLATTPAPKPQPAPTPALTLEQRILLMPEADTLKQRYPAPVELNLSSFQRVVFAVQSRLKDLKYPPGGLDGKWGPLTKEALLAAQADNGIPATGIVDEATVKTALNWKERQFVPEREHATPEKVEQTVPVAQENAKTRWWSKIGAWLGIGVGSVGTVGQVVEATGQAKTIMDTVKDYLPSTSAIVVSLVFLAILFFVIRSAKKTSEQVTEDVRSGALR